MPTATFLNLPKEKQTKILNAAKHEFGKNSVEEASVKNIVTVSYTHLDVYKRQA